jgi:hypothetical protein
MVNDGAGGQFPAVFADVFPGAGFVIVVEGEEDAAVDVGFRSALAEQGGGTVRIIPHGNRETGVRGVGDEVAVAGLHGLMDVQIARGIEHVGRQAGHDGMVLVHEDVIGKRLLGGLILGHPVPEVCPREEHAAQQQGHVQVVPLRPLGGVGVELAAGGGPMDNHEVLGFHAGDLVGVERAELAGVSRTGSDLDVVAEGAKEAGQSLVIGFEFGTIGHQHDGAGRVQRLQARRQKNGADGKSLAQCENAVSPGRSLFYRGDFHTR